MDKHPDWNTAYKTINPLLQPPLAAGLIQQLLDVCAPLVPVSTKHAIEIGCFPGKFIEYVGQRGWTVSGIDTYPDVVQIGEWARSRGRTVGKFECTPLSDFANSNREKFDFVFSLGFIEHFDNFCSVVEQHAAICNLGGTVLIGAPNFATPFQRALHQTLDAENLSRHVLHSMYPEAWAIALGTLGFEVMYAGSAGGFGFWSDSPCINSKIRLLQHQIPQMQSIVHQLSSNFNRTEASYVIVIGKKVQSSYPHALKRAQNHIIQLAKTVSESDDKLSHPIRQLLEQLIA